MSDILKCPYCNKPLHCKITHMSDVYAINIYYCDNPECESTEFLVGCKEFWDILGQLIHTRKALDIAKERLKNIILDAETLATPEYLASRARETLAEITALEQKDVK